MNLNINISKIVVMIADGTDRVSIYTDMPSPYPPDVSDEPLVIDFQTTKGKGVQYVIDNFKIMPDVLDIQAKINERRKSLNL